MGILVIKLITLTLCCQVQRSSTAFKSVDDLVLGELFLNYTYHSRPMLAVNETVPITIDFVLGHILDVNARTHSLRLSLALTFTWVDPRLTWTVSDVRPESVVVAKKTIWTPGINLRNSVGAKKLDRKLFLNPTIRHTGQVSLRYAGVVECSCQMDMWKFPVDTQVCSIVLGCHTCTFNNVTLNPGLSYITDHYTFGSEHMNTEDWVVKSITMTSIPRKYWKTSLQTLQIRLAISRQPYYFIVTAALPMVSLSSLNPFVFLLPVDHGERVSVSVSVLLSNTLLLFTVSDISGADDYSHFRNMAHLSWLMSTLIAFFVIVISRLSVWKGRISQGRVFLFLAKCVTWKKVNKVQAEADKPSSENNTTSQILDGDEAFIYETVSDGSPFHLGRDGENEAVTAREKNDAQKCNDSLSGYELAVIVNRVAFFLACIVLIGGYVTFFVLIAT